MAKTNDPKREKSGQDGIRKPQVPLDNDQNPTPKPEIRRISHGQDVTNQGNRVTARSTDPSFTPSADRSSDVPFKSDRQTDPTVADPDRKSDAAEVTRIRPRRVNPTHKVELPSKRASNVPKRLEQTGKIILPSTLTDVHQATDSRPKSEPAATNPKPLSVSPLPSEPKRQEKQPLATSHPEHQTAQSSVASTLSKKRRKRTKLLIIVLDIIIVLSLLGAAYFYFMPKYRAGKQKEVEKDVLQKFAVALSETEPTEQAEDEPQTTYPNMTIAVDPDAYRVPGEGYENFGGEVVEHQPVLDEQGNVIISYLGTLQIPKIDLTTPIATDDSLVALRYSAGHSPGTAQIGENGRSSILGHYFMDNSGRVFSRLEEVEVGDTFSIDLMKDKRRYHYRVREVQMILPEELYGMIYENNVTDHHEVMLVTCHVDRWYNATHRFLVFGEFVRSEAIYGPGNQHESQ